MTDPVDGPQWLYLEVHEDQKKWVAQIVGEDPIFKLKRAFLPEWQANSYALYDGVYQIHGSHPGISPFTKEYCRVDQGQMTRRLSLGQVMALLPEIQGSKSLRISQLKQQIYQVLDEIVSGVDHPFIWEEIQYQKDQVEEMEDPDQLLAGLRQVLKQKDHWIQTYRRRLKPLDSGG